MTEDDGYVYTEMNPVLIDMLLDKNSFLIDRWDRMIAWHEAQYKFYVSQHVLAEARAMMEWQGAVGKAKAAAITNPSVEAARIKMDIANAQLGVCTRRMHSLEKEAINLATRNKGIMQAYNNGGGSY